MIEVERCLVQQDNTGRTMDCATIRTTQASIYGTSERHDMESPQFEVTDETRLPSSSQDTQIDLSLNKEGMESTTCSQDIFFN